MQQRQSYHLLGSVLTCAGDDAMGLFAWSIRTSVHGMTAHAAYVSQALHALITGVSTTKIESRLAMLADLDSNAVAELIQTSAGDMQFSRRWNTYNQLAPLGVNTQISPQRLAADSRHVRHSLVAEEEASRPVREHMIASCLHHLQPREGQPARAYTSRRLLNNLDKLGIHHPGLRDVCLSLYENPWADLQSSASILACSSRTLQRMLYAAGLNFANLRMAIRLNLAADAMRIGKPSLTGIAQQSGFYDAAHMDHSWKLATGISPSQYRQLLTLNAF